jgi:hypothetical protein
MMWMHTTDVNAEIWTNVSDALVLSFKRAHGEGEVNAVAARVLRQGVMRTVATTHMGTFERLHAFAERSPWVRVQPVTPPPAAGEAWRQYVNLEQLTEVSLVPIPTANAESPSAQLVLQVTYMPADAPTRTTSEVLGLVVDAEVIEAVLARLTRGPSRKAV